MSGCIGESTREHSNEVMVSRDAACVVVHLLGALLFLPFPW